MEQMDGFINKMLKDTQIIIGIIIGISAFISYLYYLFKFVNRIDTNSTMHQKEMQEFKRLHQKEMQEFKRMLFEDDGKPKFVRTEHCIKNREEIAETIEKSFKILKYELMEAIEGKTHNAIKRIHEKIERVERDIINLREKNG